MKTMDVYWRSRMGYLGRGAGEKSLCTSYLAFSFGSSTFFFFVITSFYDDMIISNNTRDYERFLG
jgi:hypothetical protein